MSSLAMKLSKKQITIIENYYKAKYVISTTYNGTNVPVHIFHQTDGPTEYSDYFMIYYDTELKIADGAWIEDVVLDAIEADNGEVIHSRYRHDFRTSEDGSVFIDGGREYTRRSLKGKARTITIKDGVKIIT